MADNNVIPTIPQITIGQLPEVIDTFVVKFNKPLMIWGAFGIGKTDGMRQAAEAAGAFPCVILASQYESVDIRGLPAPDPTQDSTRWLKASTFPFKGNKGFPKNKPIWLILDEITSATSPVMAVLYQLVHEKRVGEFELMDNVFIIAAGNREQDKGIVNRMPMPLCNRFAHVEAIVDPDAFSNYAASVGLSPVGIAFLQFRKNLLHNYNPASTDKIVATPRSWEAALRAYVREDISPAMRDLAVAANVGVGPAAEFHGFVTVWQRIGGLVPRIIKDPEKAPLLTELSEQYAVAVCLAGEMTPKNSKAIYTYLQRMETMYTVLAMMQAVRRDKKLYETDEFTDFATRYKSVFQRS